MEIIHQTGKKKYADVISKTKDINAENYHPYDYIDMYKALNTADLVIGRSGASTLTEILTQKVPAIFVPYPFAADNHQYFNALSSAEAGASVLIEENKLTPEGLFDIISDLFAHPEKLAQMSENAEKVLVDNPETKIAEVIFRALDE